MSRLIRMDSTGHTTLAEWTADDPAAVEARRRGVPRASSTAGYFAMVTTGEGHAEQVTRAAARRRARDPAPADRRRLAAVPSRGRAERAAALPELAAVHWRPRVDAARLRRRGALWTLTTVAPLVPFLGRRRRCSSRSSRWRSRSALALLAHAWVDPRALRPARRERRAPARRAAATRPERAALGLLGDLVGHEARELHARTGLVLERGALGDWLVGEAGALLRARPAGGA